MTLHDINIVNTQTEEILLSETETEVAEIETKDQQVQDLRKKLAEREASLAIHMAVSVEKAQNLVRDKIA